MGIGGDLNDSIPLLFLALLAASLAHLRAAVLDLLYSLGLSPALLSDSDEAGPEPSPPLEASAAAAALAERVDGAHRAFEYEGEGRPRCVVCLSRVRRGEQVRRLGCAHLFHRRCLDGWVGRRNVGCPLCRAPMVSGDVAGVPVAGVELVDWVGRPVAVGPAFFDDA